MKKGFKVSRFYDHENQHICWYCDIIDTTFDAELNAYTFTDLLVDVILTPDGSIKVVDVDELADAMENKLISQGMLDVYKRQIWERVFVAPRTFTAAPWNTSITRSSAAR